MSPFHPTSWVAQATALWPSRRPSRHPSPSYRPSLEVLEDRTVPTTVTLSAKPNPAQTGQPVTLTATASLSFPTGVFGTGTLSILEGSTTLASKKFDGSGMIFPYDELKFTTSSLAVGNHALRAHYSGDIANPAANSPVVTQVIKALASTDGATDVTAQVTVRRSQRRSDPAHPGWFRVKLRLRNDSATPIQGPLNVVLRGLPRGVRLRRISGLTQVHGRFGDPFLRFPPDGDNVLSPNETSTVTLVFRNLGPKRLHFTVQVLAGTGVV